MTRHSFIARLSAKDDVTIALADAHSQSTELQFIQAGQRLECGFGQFIDRMSAAGVVPTETAIDLAILAGLVHAADTNVSRSIDAQDSWTREIDLYLPVSDVTRWTHCTANVERVLAFLTGDRWRIILRPRGSDLAVLRPSPALTPNEATSICLFSGGLDSYCGAIDLLAEGARPLFVSHYWDNSTSSQERCFATLTARYPDIAGNHLRGHVGFDKNDFPREMGHEPTTRGRSFLFFTLAAVVASGLGGTTTIVVPENGLISLNVPLDPLRVGAWSTRTTHPFYMARWQEILDALGINAQLNNPYRFCTKGEMLGASRDQSLLKSHIADTISCSSIAKARWKGKAPEHCGFCVPCLIRRAATQAAFKTDSTSYTLPAFDKPLNAASVQSEHVRSFQLMARRLHARPSLARILVHKSGPLSDYPHSDIAQYADVFNRGIREVDNIIGRTRFT